MDAREELKRWIALVIELSADEESKVIKQDIDVLLSAAGTLTGTLASRNTALARQIRPRSASAPQPRPQKAQKEPEPSSSSDDTPESDKDAEARSQERSGGNAVDQSEQDRGDTAASMRHEIYGQQDDEQELRQAAKAIAR